MTAPAIVLRPRTANEAMLDAEILMAMAALTGVGALLVVVVPAPEPCVVRVGTGAGAAVVTPGGRVGVAVPVDVVDKGAIENGPLVA